ncbi:MAG: site-2 protease family protein [Thermoleophilaceae bacterium]
MTGTAVRTRERGGGPMQASFSIGRVAGIEIGVNWSWLIIFALIAWSLAAAIFPETNPGLSTGAYVAMAAVAAVLFFVSLLLHELGHATVARREGMDIDGIVLWLFGGVARFKGLFPSAGAELRIALAGPAVTVVIAAVLLALAWAVPLPAGVDGVVTWLGTINVVLLVFNMLPALPLDGGRVLRAILWSSTGDFTRATQIAGALGRGFGIVMIAGGFLMLFLAGAAGGLWLALIGWFLMAAASAESNLATVREALGTLDVRDAMASEPIVAHPDMGVDRFVDELFTRSRHAAYPVVGDGGDVVGLLGFRDVAALAPERWTATRVRDLARPVADVLVLAPTDDLGSAAMELSQTQIGRALVLDDGRLVGLLSMTDVSRLIEIRRHGTNGSAPVAARSRAPGAAGA